MEPRGRKGRWDVLVATSHDYYLKRQDIKVSGRREVEGTQDGKRRGTEENPRGKTGRKHMRAPQTQALSRGLGLVLTLEPNPPRDRADNRKRADKGSRCRNTGGQVKAYHLRWEKVTATCLSRCPCASWPAVPGLPSTLGHTCEVLAAQLGKPLSKTPSTGTQEVPDCPVLLAQQ